MKRLLLITIVAVLLCGCNVTQRSNLEFALGKALTVGTEIEKMEREQGDTQTADRIVVWLEAGQKIKDTGSYADNCELMQSVADIAYQWVSEKYPDKPYRIYFALLRDELVGYCGEVGK